MAVSYNKLWKLLVDKNMNKNRFKSKSGYRNGDVGKIREESACKYGRNDENMRRS